MSTIRHGDRGTGRLLIISALRKMNMDEFNFFLETGLDHPSAVPDVPRRSGHFAGGSYGRHLRQAQADLSQLR